jgi:tetratricopeptide (TPR) repeat protein
VCIELNLPVEAKKSLQKAVELEPANPDYNYARGSVELQGKAAWDAIPYFRKYVAARPNDPRGHFALGVAEFGSKDYQAAAAEMTRVAHNSETAAGAEYFLGRIAKADGDWLEAAEHLQRSINADPNYAESHAEIAVTKLHLHDIDRARQEVDLALKLNRDSYLVNADLLILYQWTKDERLTEQRNRLDQLDAERSQKQELMLRTIQVRR